MIRRLFISSLFICLAACAGTAPEVQRYQLPSTALTDRSERVQQPVILLAPVVLSELLYQPGIVMQLDDITLHPARQHVWANDLQQQLTLGLQRRLQQRLDNHLVLVDRLSGQNTADKQLRIRLDAFQGHYEGFALTEGQWQLLDRDGALEKNASIQLQTVLNEDGYAALVRALGNNLDQLADQIAQQLNR